VSALAAATSLCALRHATASSDVPVKPPIEPVLMMPVGCSVPAQVSLAHVQATSELEATRPATFGAQLVDRRQREVEKQ
jgi:hypothetical protein